MAKNKEIIVKGQSISIISIENNDYISLTDMVKNSESEDLIRNWMRNKNTIEFLGTWEQLYNPHFKGVEFDTFLNEAGFNRFSMTPKKWIENTNAIGLISKSGRKGGTFAHKDIAFEFGAWISPIFKLYLIKEFQRLKTEESNQLGLEWNVKRMLSKVNYNIHTEAVKNFVIPFKSESVEEWVIYAEEADILNIALFGCTANAWRIHNPELVKKGLNIRDCATVEELTILSMIEPINATLMEQKLPKMERLRKLQEFVRGQRNRLQNVSLINKVKEQQKIQIPKSENNNDTFDDSMGKILGFDVDE